MKHFRRAHLLPYSLKRLEEWQNLSQLRLRPKKVIVFEKPQKNYKGSLVSTVTLQTRVTLIIGIVVLNQLSEMLQIFTGAPQVSGVTSLGGHFSRLFSKGICLFIA